MKAVLDEALRDVASVEHVVVWRRSEGECPWTDGRDVWWHDAVAESAGTLAPLELDAEHPYLLAYTSGPTGSVQGLPASTCRSQAWRL